MKAYIFFFFLCWCSLVHALQDDFYPKTTGVSDSVEVSGHLIWKDTSLTSFPERLRFSPIQHHKNVRLIPVDSLGYFKTRLRPGTYTIKPALKYHWIKKQLVCIDPKNSTYTLHLAQVPELKLVVTLNTIPCSQDH